MVREYSRHHRDSSLVNDHQWDLDIPDDPCVFTKVFSLLNRKRRCPIPFVPVILEISETWSSVSPYLIQSCYWHCHLLALWYSHSCDLLHITTWMKSHRVGLEYFSVTWKNKFRSWCIRLYILYWKPKRHIFSHPVTVWWLMQSKLPPEVVIKYDLTI
jgi:hypothetical protein